MKRILTLGLAGMLFASCQQKKDNQNNLAVGNQAVISSPVGSASAPVSPDAAVLTFEKASYDFGKIKQGESIHYDFKFKNTGKTPLIISNATATCGCTIPEPPKDPILPGSEGLIKVVFNSTGKMGVQDKVITVTSNANPGSSEVHLVGEVTQP